VTSSLLRMERVEKRFGAVRALSGVDLAVNSGEVHALLGENGAGKSTLMKVLSGAVLPDSGVMTLGGAPFVPRGPREAAEAGVAMIYQELTLAEHLTVAENVVLGREPRRLGLVRRDAVREIARDALGRLGHGDLPLDRPVRELGPGERQLVEIARALAGSARVVVMDEPTSSLTRVDAERLFEVMRRLASAGVAVIYISHFIEEVLRVASRYTVLRDGRTAGTGLVEGTSARDLIEQMAGRAVSDVFAKAERVPGEVLLELEGLAGDPLPDGVSLALRRGEVLGVAGLLGAGRTEMLRAVFGLAKVRAGRIRVGAVWDRGRTPKQRLLAGVGLLSEDRAAEGLALGMTVADNVTLSHLGRMRRRGLVDRAAQRARASRWIEALGIRTSDPEARAGALSGGNQQKVALARLLDLDVDVALLDEPTRGVDVGSRAEIYRVIGDLAARGKAILLVSSYVPELLGVADRIAVMHRGKLSSVRPANEWTETRILEAAAMGASA
jgi:ribose transport system ATP-binding protein